MSTTTLSALADVQPLRTIPIPGDPSIPTRTRWVLTGINNARGERVKLVDWKVGGRLYTTAPAIDQFLAALNSSRLDNKSPNDTARRGRETGAALEGMGY